MSDESPPSPQSGQWWEAAERHVLRSDGLPWADKGEDPRERDGPRRIYVIACSGMSARVLPRYTLKNHHRDDRRAYVSDPHSEDDCARPPCLLDLEGRIPIQECFVGVENFRRFSCLEKPHVRGQLADRLSGVR